MANTKTPTYIFTIILTLAPLLVQHSKTDPLTMGPEPGSKLVWKAHGIYRSAAQDKTGLLMIMNLTFKHGKYNGSTLSLLGQNTVFSTVREMPIVGGSGAFQFARGYAQAKTHTFDVKTGDAAVEYSVYVFHY